MMGVSSAGAVGSISTNPLPRFGPLTPGPETAGRRPSISVDQPVKHQAPSHATGNPDTRQPSGDQPSIGAVWHLPSAVVFVLTALLVLGADLFTKQWAFQHVAGQPVVLGDALPEGQPVVIPAHDQVNVIPYVLSLKLTLNTGAIFGLGKGAQGVFVVVSILAVAGIVWMFSHMPPGEYLAHLPLSLILAGALGNLYDRIRFNAVRDLLYLFPGVRLPWGLRWPGGADVLYPWIFNVADVALVVGVGLMTTLLWWHRKQIQQEQGEPAVKRPAG